MSDSKTSTDTYIYFMYKEKYLIADIEGCAKSDRTFDMPMFDLANNEKLLDQLNLIYMGSGRGISRTCNETGRWFCGYLSAFKNENNGQYEKSLTNPTVRLLIIDESLLQEIKKII